MNKDDMDLWLRGVLLNFAFVVICVGLVGLLLSSAHCDPTIASHR